MNYTKEKLGVAIEHLITGEKDARHRLAEAFEYYLYTLNESDFPKKFRKRFNEIKERVTKNGPIMSLDGKTVIKGSYENSIRGMQNRTASKMIESLYQIYKEL